jgi:hypothetical protein
MRRLLVSRFWSPPLFFAQSPAERALNMVLPPLTWGLVCGLLSGVNRVAFLVGIALSVFGAFGAGRQQLGIGSGLLRGVFAGALFGASVLTGHVLIGSGSLLFHPASLQVFFTAVLGACFAAWGGGSR